MRAPETSRKVRTLRKRWESHLAAKALNASLLTGRETDDIETSSENSCINERQMAQNRHFDNVNS